MSNHLNRHGDFRCFTYLKPRASRSFIRGDSSGSGASRRSCFVSPNIPDTRVSIRRREIYASILDGSSSYVIDRSACEVRACHLRAFVRHVRVYVPRSSRYICREQPPLSWWLIIRAIMRVILQVSRSSRSARKSRREITRPRVACARVYVCTCMMHAPSFATGNCVPSTCLRVLALIAPTIIIARSRSRYNVRARSPRIRGFLLGELDFLFTAFYNFSSLKNSQLRYPFVEKSRIFSPGDASRGIPRILEGESGRAVGKAPPKWRARDGDRTYYPASLAIRCTRVRARARAAADKQ